jgi:hypothetical protein
MLGVTANEWLTPSASCGFVSGGWSGSISADLESILDLDWVLPEAPSEFEQAIAGGLWACLQRTDCCSFLAVLEKTLALELPGRAPLQPGNPLAVASHCLVAPGPFREWRVK